MTVCCSFETCFIWFDFHLITSTQWSLIGDDLRSAFYLSDLRFLFSKTPQITIYEKNYPTRKLYFRLPNVSRKHLRLTSIFPTLLAPTSFCWRLDITHFSFSLDEKKYIRPPRNVHSCLDDEIQRPTEVRCKKASKKRYRMNFSFLLLPLKWFVI